MDKKTKAAVRKILRLFKKKEITKALIKEAIQHEHKNRTDRTDRE